MVESIVMKVTVKLFASFREAAATPQREFEVEPGTTIEQLWGEIVEQHPRLAPLSRSAGYALNGRYTQAATLLTEGDIVAFLPPVSGG
jgi:molybdopterin converting factor subunit 1